MSLALIIGASRGLGLALAAEYLSRGWQVIATQRDPSSGLALLAAKYSGQLAIETLDITIPDQITNLRQHLDGRALDVLFINAGVAGDPMEPIGAVATEEFIRVMVTNALAPMRVVENLEDLVPASGSIAVMTSMLGSVADNESGTWEVYRASKAALNTLMRSFAARHRGDPRSLVLMAPGWVRTDMGGPNAHLGISESIPRVVDVVSQYAGQGGLRYLDYKGQTMRW
jgi:NAD(P)-dependent dehydrogenase (short-subunit alcohol dehydrogenase family)